MSDPSDEEEELRNLPPGPEVTRELYLEWRAPRLGSSNPERMDNPVWDWLARSGVSAYSAKERFDGPSPFEAGPGWCCQRFGQSSTRLPDGRIVLIAGEHEDHYDPDFYIYNDVIVRHPDSRIEIFGYPREVFPPTDFHSATLVGDCIVIIGSLSYTDQRQPGTTQVLLLDLKSFAVAHVSTSGPSPGWIYKHEATLTEGGDAIVITGGMLDRGDQPSVENIDEWRLHLAGWRWERLTDRRWPRWEFTRQDQKRNGLFELEMALMSRGWRDSSLAKELSELTEMYGAEPDLNLAAKLFQPDIPHECIPESEDEFGVNRIKVNGVIVRYVTEMASVRMMVEGELPEGILDALTCDLLHKLSTLENTPYEIDRL